VKPVTLDEIARLDRYAELRDAYRAAVVEHKARRRLAVGERVTLVFEDHETLRFQIQEMCWIERIQDPRKIQAEIDVYNELMPAENELSATLFIEITDAREIRPELDRLIGIDEHVSLVLGDEPGASVVPARFDAKQLEEDRISAVQYIRFPLGVEGARRLLDPAVPARIRIDHPNYRCEAELPAPLRQSLVEGLTANPPALLVLQGDAAAGRARDEVLFETPRVRAYRPAHPQAPGHVVVEPIEAGGGLLDADPALLRELLEAVRRAAAGVLAEHPRCRIQTEVGPDAGPARWHLHPPERGPAL
jgi:diadenosine tetraphosphate (Ap4A) HIT family hydrolase